MIATAPTPGACHASRRPETAAFRNVKEIEVFVLQTETATATRATHTTAASASTIKFASAPYA
jgi:hypothetical protein